MPSRSQVEAWQKAMNEELQTAIGKVKETMALNHEQMKKVVDDVNGMRARGELPDAAAAAGDGAPPSDDVVKRIRIVEDSVKTFSTKLTDDVTAWQAAINAELQASLAKMRDSITRNAEAVGKVTRDIEAVAEGGKPSPPGSRAGTPKSSSRANSTADATKEHKDALAKKVKTLEATVMAHEMALQAHTETLEAHAQWLENMAGAEGEGEAEDGGDGGGAADGEAKADDT